MPESATTTLGRSSPISRTKSCRLTLDLVPSTTLSGLADTALAEGLLPSATVVADGTEVVVLGAMAKVCEQG